MSSPTPNQTYEQALAKYRADLAKYRADLAAFETKWPRYCRACGGTGEMTWMENQAPIGSGRYWMMEMSEPCDDCSGKGLCPRCGRNVWEQDGEAVGDKFVGGEIACPGCGMKIGDLRSECAPIEPEFYPW